MRDKDKEVIEKTINFVKRTLEFDATGHDWWHTNRVWNTSKTIAKKENADMFVVELAALLHDVGDYKLSIDGKDHQRELTQMWLKEQNVEESIFEKVCQIVDNISFSKNIDERKTLSLEGQIVQDADRLDAIGAIGIARVFAYGGSKKLMIHDPNMKPKLNKTTAEQKTDKNTGINHFYEKLLLLKELMNTDTGKMMAKERHSFMEKYLEEFFKEWEGER